MNKLINEPSKVTQDEVKSCNTGGELRVVACVDEWRWNNELGWTMIIERGMRWTKPIVDECRKYFVIQKKNLGWDQGINERREVTVRWTKVI